MPAETGPAFSSPPEKRLAIGAALSGDACSLDQACLAPMPWLSNGLVVGVTVPRTKQPASEGLSKENGGRIKIAKGVKQFETAGGQDETDDVV